MASSGEDEPDRSTVVNPGQFPSISDLLGRARAEGVTAEETSQRFNRALQLCSGLNQGTADADFATAALSTGDTGNRGSGRNNGLMSLNQQDGRSLGGLSQNPRPPAAEYELNRLTTYRNWPPGNPVTPQALARAGFFYTGKDDIVECFACQGQIRDFEFGDTAMGEHKKHFPRCPFVKNSKNHGNVPMAGSPDFSTVSSEPAGATGSSEEKKAKEKEASLFSAKDSEKMEASSKEKKTRGGNGAKSQNGKKQDAKASVKSDEDPATRADNQTKLVFKSEFKRLLSYQNWPESCPADPRDCAKAGFFYTGKEDIVQCFACYGKIGNFKPGDVPMVEHNRHFSSCPYILGLNVGNQPITSVQMASALQAINYKEQSMFGHVAQKQQQKTKGQLSQTAKPTADWAPGQNQKPNQKRVFAKVRHPQFAAEQARLESYDQWPPAVGIAPIQLARAGFFYTGNNDSCKCFYCDGGLKNWEPKDEPWMEHARWFPRCEWLIQQRGQAYVDYVVHNFPPPRVSAEVLSAGGYRRKYGGGGGGEDASEDEAGAFQTAQMAVTGASASDPADEREPEAGVARTTHTGASGIEDMMKTKTSKTVLDMGYSTGLVRAVLRQRWNTTRTPFDNAQDLLEAIFVAEAEGITPENEPAVDDHSGEGKGAAAKMYDTKEDNVSQLAKDIQNVTLVENQPGDDAAKGSDAGELSSSAYAGKLGGHGTTGISGSEGRIHLQTAPPAVGNTSAASVGEERPMPATVLEIKREMERIRDSQLCKICMDKEMSTVFLPCNHMVACDVCAQALSQCPICRKKIRNVVHIYKT